MYVTAFRMAQPWYILLITSYSIGKAIIVCPVTLVDNWRKEFKKWQVVECHCVEYLLIIS